MPLLHPNHETTLNTLQQMLINHEIVALPTETVYGLAGAATSDLAIHKIYAFKNRPKTNPLIIHCHSLEQAQTLARFNPTALKLAQHYWPGPLTLVLPASETYGLSKLLLNPNNQIAIRIPNHPFFLNLLQQLPFPLVAPSANISNQLSTTSADQVIDAFEDRITVVDGGFCEEGLESTIIGFNEQDYPLLFRPGILTAETLEQYLQLPVIPSNQTLTPGQHKKHYAPKAKLRLNAEQPFENEGFLDFGPLDGFRPYCKQYRNLSPTGNLKQAARNLYAALRAFDDFGIDQVAVKTIPNDGLGKVINDRLLRASYTDKD